MPKHFSRIPATPKHLSLRMTIFITSDNMEVGAIYDDRPGAFEMSGGLDDVFFIFSAFQYILGGAVRRIHG